MSRISKFLGGVNYFFFTGRPNRAVDHSWFISEGLFTGLIEPEEEKLRQIG